MIEKKLLESREEWLQARANYIGGSDAACLLGLNPWKTNVQLWNEKKHPETVREIDNEAMAYGREAEPHIRALFELDNANDYEVFYEENNIWTNSDYPFAHASLDGWLRRWHTKDDLGILEIKTASIRSMIQMKDWEDRIPNNYYCQILWYMMVTGAQYARLVALIRWAYGSKITQLRTYEIERDEEVERDIKVLADAGAKFWESLQKDKAPALILPGV